MKLNKKKIRNCLLYLLKFSFTIVPLGFGAPTVAQPTMPLIVRYNGPGNDFDRGEAVAVDRSGNFYVTGLSIGSGTGYDYATIKYSATGQQLWVRRYDGPGNTDNSANALAVDSKGNAYVPGDKANALAIDSSGNVYVTGVSVGSGTSNDYATIKYSANGEQIWVRRYNGLGNSDDSANAIAVDSSGNVYVTGASVGSGTSSDYATIKYDTNGTQLWVKRYNEANLDDSANALAVDNSGNVYVTGASVGSSTSSDYALIKYSSNGTVLWVKRYDNKSTSGNDSGDSASDLAVDAYGNVYVTGTSSGFDTSNDYATIKYSSNGTQLWIQRYNEANSDDSANALALDSYGNVYVTGSSVGFGTSEEDYATIKYDRYGNQLWLRRYNKSSIFGDRASDIALDASNNVYVTGTNSDFDYATIKYSSNGTQLWVRTYNGSSTDVTAALAVNASGNVYVTGSSYSGSTFIDYATIKYDTNGN